MDSIIKKFTDGTVTMIYNTNKISKEDINNFHIDIVHMFTSGLNHVNVEIKINDDELFNNENVFEFENLPDFRNQKIRHSVNVLS